MPIRAPRLCSIAGITASLLLVGAISRLQAGILITPELQQLSEEDRSRQLEREAEISLREKIEVGAQRHQARRAIRQELIEGMHTNLEERRREITVVRGQVLAPAAASEGERKPPSQTPTTLLGMLALLIAALLIIRFTNQASKTAAG